MRVSMNLNLGAYSGKYRNVVYNQYFNYRLCHARIFTYPKLTEQNLLLREVNANLNGLYLQTAEGYRYDLFRYATQNKRENQERSPARRKQMPGAKAIFVKCMWTWAKDYPEQVDLLTITLTEMVALSSPLCRVCDLVSAGYLKKVMDWEQRNKFILADQDT